METWKAVNEWQDVSDQGRVRSWKKLGRIGGRLAVPRLLTPSPHSRGYRTVVGLARNSRPQYVHRLVLTAFLRPPEPEEECRHLNGDKTDNRLVNLAWGTAQENADDRQLHGTASGGSLPGSVHPNSKLTRDQARQIYLASDKQRDIAARFGVTQAVVHNIKAKKSYVRETEGLA